MSGLAYAITKIDNQGIEEYSFIEVVGPEKGPLGILVAD
jgi:hypothetical protein